MSYTNELIIKAVNRCCRSDAGSGAAYSSSPRSHPHGPADGPMVWSPIVYKPMSHTVPTAVIPMIRCKSTYGSTGVNTRCDPWKMRACDALSSDDDYSINIAVWITPVATSDSSVVCNPSPTPVRYQRSSSITLISYSCGAVRGRRSSSG